MQNGKECYQEDLTHFNKNVESTQSLLAAQRANVEAAFVFHANLHYFLGYGSIWTVKKAVCGRLC